MSQSLLAYCARCNKPVITKHKSKRRCCSHACFMAMWRNDRKLAEQATQESQAA